MSVSRSAFDVAAGLVGVVGIRRLGIGETPMRIRAGYGGAACGFRNVVTGGARRHGVELGREIALLVPLGQDGDGEIRAIALTEPAADAVGGLDDRVVRQEETVLRADLDADVAAFTPLVGPADVDVVDDGGGAMGTFFGGVWGSRGCSPDSIRARASEYGVLSLRN
jgi:hypothetical protein